MMRARPLLALVLAGATTLAGCVSVVPGYSFLGEPLTKEDRDRDDHSPVFYLWENVPDPPPSEGSVGAAFANVGVTILVTSVVIVDVIGLLCLLGALDGHHDEEHENRRDDAPSHHERKPGRHE
jgi:hypothetical protein